MLGNKEFFQRIVQSKEMSLKTGSFNCSYELIVTLIVPFGSIVNSVSGGVWMKSVVSYIMYSKSTVSTESKKLNLEQSSDLFYILVRLNEIS